MLNTSNSSSNGSKRTFKVGAVVEKNSFLKIIMETKDSSECAVLFYCFQHTETSHSGGVIESIPITTNESTAIGKEKVSPTNAYVLRQQGKAWTVEWCQEKGGNSSQSLGYEVMRMKVWGVSDEASSLKQCLRKFSLQGKAVKGGAEERFGLGLSTAVKTYIMEFRSWLPVFGGPERVTKKAEGGLKVDLSETEFLDYFCNTNILRRLEKKPLFCGDVSSVYPDEDTFIESKTDIEIKTERDAGDEGKKRLELELHSVDEENFFESAGRGNGAEGGKEGGGFYYNTMKRITPLSGNGNTPPKKRTKEEGPPVFFPRDTKKEGGKKRSKDGEKTDKERSKDRKKTAGNECRGNNKIACEGGSSNGGHGDFFKQMQRGKGPSKKVGKKKKPKNNHKNNRGNGDSGYLLPRISGEREVRVDHFPLTLEEGASDLRGCSLSSPREDNDSGKNNVDSCSFSASMDSARVGTSCDQEGALPYCRDHHNGEDDACLPDLQPNPRFFCCTEEEGEIEEEGEKGIYFGQNSGIEEEGEEEEGEHGNNFGQNI